MSRTEIYCCSTLLSLATALAWRRGRDRADDEPVRRLLLACDYAAEPEVGTHLLQREGTAALLPEFDVVVDLNALLAPYHPASFDPGRDAAQLLGRLLAERWGATGDMELIVEPIQVAFARWLLEALPDAPVTVVSDGLMAYGPSRDRVPVSLGRRITRLVHLDLVPGLQPVYLTEHGVAPEAVPGCRLREVLDAALGCSPRGSSATPGAGVLVLGQYLSGLGILSADEECDLYLDAVVQSVGVTTDRSSVARVAFKPHPAAAPSLAAGLRRAAGAKGIELEVLPATGPAEALFASGRYRVVSGCFSTGMFTASAVYGLPALSVGTGLLLERLRPYQNSNRIPVTLADALLRPAAERPAGEEVRPEQVGELVRAVAYCMQSERYPHLREAARATLDGHPGWRVRYVKRKRLRALGFGDGASVAYGGSPASRRVGFARRLAAQAEAVRRRLRRMRASS